MDFTLNKYKELLLSIIPQDYTFQTFEEFITMPAVRAIVLRHDVDLMPYNSLAFAKFQASHNIKGVYYFRAVPESWNEKVIKEIAALGHEIGYHYECLTTAHGDLEKGMSDFENNLNNLRKLAPVKTICMHGSPMSKFDSKDLWKNYDYRNFGVLAEPYFDVDFKKVFYLTDTGRKWDGDRVSVRDKVNSGYALSFHSTNQLIQAAKRNKLPEQIMFTFHPQRWTDDYYNWTKELVFQRFKNTIKFFLVK